ncbi:hypothetical protein BYT27DRAFT_6496674 [Phlegmacium glaucopus]|nr:hypothetical protein BYT27DRAFT_6496674 [Phlegmacium glaucopus]
MLLQVWLIPCFTFYFYFLLLMDSNPHLSGEFLLACTEGIFNPTRFPEGIGLIFNYEYE